jgi:predicted nuclease of predicted toxin-antitoxin system
MKVKLDENVPLDCVDAVAAHGHDVSTIVDQSMIGWTDDAIWPRVQQEERFFITQDRGFADLRRYPPGTHHGILLLRPRKTRPKEIAAFIQRVLSTLHLDGLDGCTAGADPHGVRIRRPSC